MDRMPSDIWRRYATDQNVRRDRRRNALSNRSSLFIAEEGNITTPWCVVRMLLSTTPSRYLLVDINQSLIVSRLLIARCVIGDFALENLRTLRKRLPREQTSNFVVTYLKFLLNFDWRNRSIASQLQLIISVNQPIRLVDSDGVIDRLS